MTQTRPGDGIQDTVVASPIAVQSRWSGDDSKTYLHTDQHTKVWGNTVPNVGPIARAWARLFDMGLVFGAPLGPEFVLDDAKPNEFVQCFQWGYAVFIDDENTNPNMASNWFTASGLVTRESGL